MEIFRLFLDHIGLYAIVCRNRYKAKQLLNEDEKNKPIWENKTISVGINYILAFNLFKFK